MRKDVIGSDHGLMWCSILLFAQRDYRKPWMSSLRTDILQFWTQKQECQPFL